MSFKQEYQIQKAISLSRENVLAYSKFIRPDTIIVAHHIILTDFCMRLAFRGHPNSIDKGTVDMPPRHGKSFFVSEAFPSFLVGKVNKGETILATYGMNLSNKFAKKIKSIVRSPAHQIIFPGSEPLDTAKAAGEWETANGHFFKAAAPGSSVTGFGAGTKDVHSLWRTGLICDDLIKNRKESNSPAIIKTLHESLSNDLFTRSLPNSFTLIMGTRWSENDSQAYVERVDPGNWEKLSLQALYEDTSKPDPLNREIGGALWGDWFSRDRLLSIKAKMSPGDWASLYLGNPTTLGGSVFKETSFVFEDYPKTPSNFDTVFLAIDSASKLSQQNDYSVGYVWGIKGGTCFLLDCFRERLTLPQLLRKVYGLRSSWHVQYISIESASSGIGLAQFLKEDLPPHSVHEVSPSGDPKLKAETAAKYMDDQSIVFPNERDETLVEIIREIMSYPSGTHDDSVSALYVTSSFLDWWVKFGGLVSKPSQNIFKSGLARDILNRTKDIYGSL